MKKIVFMLFALALLVQPADAQFLKKIFKKKAKTERKAATAADGINDDLQLPMADVATCADNQNNRHAFMGIPLGLKADRFEQQLLQQGFTERKAEGPQTAKSYFYDGKVCGADVIVTLAVSERTARVYAVDVTDVAVYPSEQAVKERFKVLKQTLQETYGRGFVDTQGEAYTIQTRLGTVSLHYERAALGNSYTIGFAMDDAKAYRMAYQEMDDQAYETAPRNIENGLADACRHTDIVGLGVELMLHRTVKGAQNVLGSYDYTMGRTTAKALTASFVMGDYQATATLTRRKQAIATATLTATDDVEAVCKDLTTSGFTSSDRKTWRQGKMVVVLSADKQGRVVLAFR